MTDEFPDFGEMDWSQMEWLANNNDDAENAPMPDSEQIVLGPGMMARRVLWDVVPCDLASPTAAYLGLSPASKDVEDKEHVESHQRMISSFPLTLLVQSVAHYATRAAIASTVVHSGETDELPADGEEFKAGVERLEPVVFAACLSVLAELMDLDLIHQAHEIFVVDPSTGTEEP